MDVEVERAPLLAECHAVHAYEPPIRRGIRPALEFITRTALGLEAVQYCIGICCARDASKLSGVCPHIQDDSYRQIAKAEQCFLRARESPRQLEPEISENAVCGAQGTALHEAYE